MCVFLHYAINQRAIVHSPIAFVESGDIFSLMFSWLIPYFPVHISATMIFLEIGGLNVNATSNYQVVAKFDPQDKDQPCHFHQLKCS